MVGCDRDMQRRRGPSNPTGVLRGSHSTSELRLSFSLPCFILASRCSTMSFFAKHAGISKPQLFCEPASTKGAEPTKRFDYIIAGGEFPPLLSHQLHPRLIIFSSRWYCWMCSRLSCTSCLVPRPSVFERRSELS